MCATTVPIKWLIGIIVGQDYWLPPSFRTCMALSGTMNDIPQGGGILLNIYVVFVCVGGDCLPQPVGQRTSCESQFSPNTMWILGMKFRSSTLTISDFLYPLCNLTVPQLQVFKDYLSN